MRDNVVEQPPPIEHPPSAEEPSLPVPPRVPVILPRWLLLFLVPLVALLLLNAASLPGGGPAGAVLVTLPLALGALFAWLVRFLFALLRSPGRRAFRRHWVRWALSAPLLWLLVIGLDYTGLAFQARFALSASSLEDYARTVAAAPDGTRYQGRWVGLFPTQSAERIDGGARFQVTDNGILGRTGFAYSPQGEPASDPHITFEHLEGPWYLWESPL